MGDRYFVPVKCSVCGHEDEAYYAPTCEMTTYTCKCGNVIDLEELTGITREDASNADVIQGLIDAMLGNPLVRTVDLPE
jgi:hypothetical protein